MNVEEIKVWLLSKGVTLWASWDLSQPERLQEAAEWFKAQSDECAKFYFDSLYKPVDTRWDVV
jgi:hypothetical protein